MMNQPSLSSEEERIDLCKVSILSSSTKVELTKHFLNCMWWNQTPPCTLHHQYWKESNGWESKDQKEGSCIHFPHWGLTSSFLK